ncbi:MAG: GntR family transcriptional regulator [Desulfovibrio sp.]|nr:GntR family transcriptional regulator [Desulfovibrio sp.]
MTASQAAYERIREMLLTGDLHPGQFLKQKELLALLGLSLGPVRIALIRLETEGYLHIYPQKGIQMVESTMDLFREMLQARIALEKEAWCKFALAGSEAEINSFLETQQRLAETAKKNDSEEFFQEVHIADISMHKYVIQHMGNGVIEKQFRIVTEIARSLRKDRGRMTQNNVHKTLNTHIDIITACKKRDFTAIPAAVENHIMVALIYFCS